MRDNLGIMRRIHQEDFCQALGVPPESKYASEGGPTFKDCFELLRRVSARPATDIAKLLDAAIFNLIVGNADAHGKNYSILYDDQGPRIAPLYDSTVLYPDLSSKMAMRIGKRATIAEIDAEGWQVFAKDVGVGLALVRRRVAELSGAIMQESGESGIMSVGVLGDQGALEVSRIVNNRAKLVSLTVG
ncbi:hypothetical protein GGE12_001089 [Rhizobium mongolense]|uniref:HipA-like C-terminal domain-containing protein n=1 Tax=Rhizobium mongolense TaxID=57676 RepID=A0A7W6WD15_9HYPH|nr:hypothetical protein [Rhizobium mongolense]